MPDEGLDWDDVVDVVCVGTTPGVLAYAIFCAAADLDVIRVRAEAEDSFQFIKAERLHDDGSGELRFPPQFPRRIAARVNLV